MEAAEINREPETRGVYIRTFGCQMNVYDSEKLYKLLSDQYHPVENINDAELIIVNTCSVREKPENKLYSWLGEMWERKQEQPNLMIGVGGCVAQQEGDTIVKRSKAVDFVFGTHNISLVPALIQARSQGHKPQVAVDYREDWEELPFDYSGEDKTVKFVSISRGCNKNCSYCIVPTTRGKEVSRATEEILREVRIATHRGAKEIVLLGQTVNSYGRDFNPRMKFTELLQQVSEVDGVERIRFTSPHPQEVREDFIELVTSNPKVARHIHMPLQAGSDRILKGMNRNYRKKRYLDIIAALKERVPDIGITTDIIVGFPGETRGEFEETLEVMRECAFDNSYSFVFSARPGTKAAEMEDPVPYEQKLDWLKELQALQREITASRLAPWVGQRGEILIDGKSSADDRLFQGRLSQNILVNLVEEYDHLSVGDIVPVEITEAARFTLRGKLVG